ncbi:hypothetical protein EJ05DRAFT_494994 [Pseudovirgaria hyperparasitica]|uniref:CAP-Gly domain-containing protein n=1 Tax=Pseudovirgaria hyperparasitica TaxID=470096 RepID=A0A6A6VSW6_9PEZI|nr:uncharacterized protein EJ05DRAFT_494994 [Pseudovirgaria hyperparasitica]KAF2753245.1 hypothetical protein EJ05DRAFT_494994 [Pseudovirgaria hyperparasitica]
MATPDLPGGIDIEVGDLVDVPGGMHGTIKFVGSVRGKKGVFAGVELSEEFAMRGKNDGDVDGTFYFNTTIPGAGIFLPLHRASKRDAPPMPSLYGKDLPPTPNTPSFAPGASYNESSNKLSPPTPSLSKFSQSVGPGVRAPSPSFKAKGRPSLPRPESPLRKNQPNLPPPPARGPNASPASFSRSAIGAAPRYVSSPAPNSRGMIKPRTPGPSRPYSRNNSRLGQHPPIEEDCDSTPTGIARGSNGSMSSSTFRPRSRLDSSHSDEEVHRLHKKLEERDRQLKEQAASLADMESSISELQNMLPDQGNSRNPGPLEDGDISTLRALLREKNEKISMLTAEFDNHRADFRSTIDTLEMASTETVRVYEKRVTDLTQEITDLQERDEDVESVATQLKQLEELVQELEEGLEDARRGEAEARGEVEFLRGEVERGRSELRREREKAAAALKSANASIDGPMSQDGQREVAQRDDEIRGLKAIIHSLSSGPDTSARASPALRNVTASTKDSEDFKAMQSKLDLAEREKTELRGLIERKSHREEELERELERLRGTTTVDQRDSVISNNLSERTALQDKRSSARDSKGTVVSWRETNHLKSEPLEPMIESDAQSSVDGSQGTLWCEICETGGHDILNCTAMGVSGESNRQPLDRKKINFENAPAPLTPKRTAVSISGNAPSAPLPNPYDSTMVAGKGSSIADPSRWCALCERDGHDATACPFEDAF